MVSWLSGELPQRQIGVGWAALRSLPEPAAEPSLRVRDVDAALSDIGAVSGKGSQARRAELLAQLFTAATEVEQTFLRRLLAGELRQGALIGVMADAVGRAAGIPAAVVRRAAMLGGDLPAVAAAALSGGAGALDQFTLQVGRPVGPMLAQTASDVADALARLGGVGGVRGEAGWRAGADPPRRRRGLDLHPQSRRRHRAASRGRRRRPRAAGHRPDRRRGGDRAATRRTPPPLPGHRVEIRQTGRQRNRTGIPALSVFFFDVLHVDGEDLLDRPTAERLATLDAIVPDHQRVDRLHTADAEAAQGFLDATLAAGHEGVMAKSPAAPYEAGRRGAGWLKVKPVHTLDLVVLAVEWGSGRRTGKLSNIHLGARDPATGGFVMLGKTFKGMTDDMLSWQTERFLELATARQTSTW